MDLCARVSIEHRTKGEDGSISDDGDTDDDSSHSPNDWEAILGVGEELRREVVQWILEVRLLAIICIIFTSLSFI